MKKISFFVALFAIILVISGCGTKAGTPANSSPANTDTIRATAPLIKDCSTDTTCTGQLLADCTIGQFTFNNYQFEIKNKITAGCVTAVSNPKTGGQARCLFPLGLNNVRQLGTLIAENQIELADREVTGVCNPILNTI